MQSVGYSVYPTKDQCDVNTEVSFFDLVMDLVYNLRVLHEYKEENDLKLLNACK